MSQEDPRASRSGKTVVAVGIAIAVTLGSTCAGEVRSGNDTASSSTGAPRTAPAPALDVVIYDKGLAKQWEDYGWAPRDLEKGKVARVNLERYGGWIVARPGLSGRFEKLVFHYRAVDVPAGFLGVRLGNDKDQSFSEIVVGPEHQRALDDGWQEVVLGLDVLNPSRLTFDRVVFRATRGLPATWVELDHIGLVGKMGGAPGMASSMTAETKGVEVGPLKRDVSLEIDCGGDTRVINPNIYGIAFNPMEAGKDGEVWDLNPSARRFGGNPASRFNWKIGNAWNTAEDWFFKNVNYTGNPKWNWRNFLEENQRRGTASALTVPTLGYVAKDHSSYSFPVSEFGPQQYTAPETPDAGNGQNPAGRPIKPGPPSRTSIEAPPAFVGEWVRTIETEAKGAHLVDLYFLDNEPMLWHNTHRDVHPGAVGYDELLEKTIAFGGAVRKAAPSAKIAGPSTWGWPAYFYSAKDAEAGFRLRPDRRAHGDAPLLEWYLKQLAAHEKKTGERLLDVLDIHFYPQGSGVYSDKADPKTAALRLRSTRALWDPSYVDESWIDEAIALIPRMQKLIDQSYPGLELSLGEWSFGGENHMSGALALAEALGRFGRHGLSRAYYWTYPKRGSPTFEAFRAFRNYDGKGARFLDLGLATTAPDEVSLFASRDALKKKVVAVALNLSELEAARARVEVKGCGSAKKTRAYTLTDTSGGLVPYDVKAEGKTLEVALPAYSVTVLEVELE